MRRVIVIGLCAFFLGCGDDETEAGPLGIPVLQDGRLYAGVAVVDITPAIGETFDDLDGDNYFGGCVDDPAASSADCPEPFDDANGNGHFDPVWIGGFGPKRPALGVHDPVYARALVLSFDGGYVAMVSLDLVGLGSPRIHQARDRLVAEGFEQDRLIVASTHNHQGPDSMGLWGDPENFVSGLDQAYQARLADSIEAAVRQAAAGMQPVSLTVGAVALRDVEPKWFNGASFGGKNPTATMHGLIHDIRDPIVVSDQLLVLQGRGDDGAVVFTLTNWSGHPETRASSNNLLSSDWVGPERELLEARYGGVALHFPESLGGMQSALGGDVPLVRDGAVVHEGVDADGDDVPAWAEHDSWEFVGSLGWHVAEAATLALDQGETVTQAPIRVEAESFVIPVENVVYNLLGPLDIFDLGLDEAIVDPARCPEADDGTTQLGCLEVRTFRLQLGPVGFTAVPGELLPELAWGLPVDDPRWLAEVDDPTARGATAVYFPQHDPNCNDVEYVDCQPVMAIDDCDCTHVHAWPYVLSHEASQKPLLDAWDPAAARYRAVLGMTDNYLSYIVPEPDFNTAVSLLTDDGDHYEDTVSPTHVFATRVQEAQARIDARW
jgi:hypothetical protein